nr:hypothetical protein [Tanacetum cinerariifolium]
MPPKRTSIPMTDAAIKALIVQGVATALAEYEANRGSGHGDDSPDSGSTEGVVGRTQWFEKIEYDILRKQLHRRVPNHVCYMYSTWKSLTWWNSHVKNVGHNVAYGMPWKTLMKMLTDKYCPRGENKKLEIEM